VKLKLLDWLLPIGMLKLRFDGGDSGGSQPTNTTSTTQVQNFGPAEQANRDALQTEAKRIYEATRGQFATYPGAQIAGPSAATQNAEAGMMNLARDVGGTVVPNIQGAMNYNLNAARDVQNNPFLAGAMEAALRPMGEQFSQAGGTLSGIRSGSMDAGQYGGSRQGIAEGIAMRGLANSMGDVVSKMGSDAYGKGLDASVKAVASAPMAMSAMAVPTSWESAVGAQQDMRAQQALNREADVTQWGMNADWIPLRNYANMIYGGGSSGGTTTSTTPTYSPPGQSGLSQLGTLAGIGSAAASMSSEGF
jgi:hypothetical protein